MKGFYGLAMFVMLWSACGKPVSEEGSERGSTTTSPDEDIGYAFSAGDMQIVADAYTQVTGLMEVAYTLTPRGRDEPVASSVVMRAARYVFAEDVNPSDLGEEEQKLLARYCGSVFLTYDEAAVAEPVYEADVNPGHVFLGWRSHFGQEDRDGLAAILLKFDGKRLLCGIEVWPQLPDARGDSHVFVFDPVPAAGDDTYGGTENIEKAQDQVVTLPVLQHAGEAPLGMYAWPIDEALLEDMDYGDPAVKALNNADKAVTVGQADETCVTRYTDQYRAYAPEQSFDLAMASVDGLDLALLSVEAIAPVNGPLQDACKGLDVTIDKQNQQVSVQGTCEAVAALWNESEKTCDLALTLSPASDVASAETIRLQVAMPYEIVDLSDEVGAISILPESERNPARAATVALNFFSEAQEAAIEQAFDVWLAVSGHSYDDFFDGHITDIDYDSDTSASAPCSDAGAYAYLNTNKFYWCPAGAMLPKYTEAATSPMASVYRAITALHETIHTHGRPHDYTNVSLASCTSTGGTSYSGVIAVDLFSCEEDYCFGLKDSAREQLVSEINYSLYEDARRFSGVCADWAETLGVSY